MPHRAAPMPRQAISTPGQVPSPQTLSRMRQGPSPALRQSERLWRANRALALERDRWECILCGAPAVHVHHRLCRGSGGSSRNPAIHAASNVISVCAIDHNRIESHRAWAYTVGLLVHRGDDPADIPVNTPTCSLQFTDNWRRFVGERPDHSQDNWH